jgi:DnaK suppressor protein
MKVQEYKQRLIDLEKRLSRRISDERQQAREQVLDSPRDAAEDSVADENESVDFVVAELDMTALEQIRDALQRIEDGTFGRCIVDGEPIEPKRLEAVPWTPYCLKHQNELATESAARTPSL